MVIKASSSAEVRALVDSLIHGEEVRREAAIARLVIIGPRAVERLLAAFESQHDPAAQTAMLRALEAIGDPRALPAARAAMRQGGGVTLAAIGVLHALLDSPRGTESLDILVAAALDVSAERHVRVAALDALQNMSESVRGPVAAALERDPDGLLRDRVRSAVDEPLAAEALWMDVLSGRLPDEPGDLRALLLTRAATTPLNDLQKLVDAVREAEHASRERVLQQEWQEVRGAIHQALAIRGSRVALYDLRETVERTKEPLPISFLAAVQVLGNSSLLEPIAGALSRVPPDDEWWRAQLVAAFRTITQREKVTRRHSTFKRIAARWPDLAAELRGNP
jgi:HEAT repeat protein